MSTSATWTLVLTAPAQNQIERASAWDRERIHAALEKMAVAPFQGDVKYLTGQKGRLRRRVGDWRIFFHLEFDRKHIVVTAIVRRTSTTY